MYTDGGRAEISPSYVGNVRDLLILVSQHKAACGEAFLVTDGENITVREFIEKMADAVGFAKSKMSVPFGFAYATAAVTEKFHVLCGSKKPPLMTRYTVVFSGRTLTFSCEKAKRMLGYHPVVSIDGGMRRLTAWIKAIGGVDNLIQET